ncbi:MAG: 30S ribosomal protein S1 [Clostridia bacterium]|nr:30S ribosomal protein S1 [Clostridia bacterium]
MTNKYLPEGELLNTAFNSEYTESISGLERAKNEGVILEGRAVLCDSQHNLYVEIGAYKGIIPRQEAVYSPSGEAVKDIAVITRVGKSVCFKVMQIEQDENGVRIVLSRKQAQKECCDNYVSRLYPGDIIEAAVTHMEQFGVFCDIGCGMIGLMPVDCISVSRISHPSERFVSGQRIKCVVKGTEPEICRITLTHKELLGTWEENALIFRAGETVAGIVRSVESYGIFVELTPNLAGLAEWCDGVSVGQTAAVYIKSIIPEKMKIKLVIVDVVDTFTQPEEIEYRIESGHMDVWRYSPEECQKEVYTEF